MPNGSAGPDTLVKGSNPAPPMSAERIERKLPSPNEPGSDKLPDSSSDAPPDPQDPEPYIFPSGPSKPADWARDSVRLEKIRGTYGAVPGPWAPQITETRDLVRQNAMFFAKSGSRPSAIRAARMFAYNDKYWKDYLNAKHVLAGLAHQQYEQEQLELTKNERDMFRQYANAFAVFQDDKPETIEQLKQRLILLGRRFDDEDIRRMAEQGDINGIKRVIQDRVNHNESLLHIQEQRANVERLEQATKNAQDEAALRREFFPELEAPPSPAPTTATPIAPAAPVAPSVPDATTAAPAAPTVPPAPAIHAPASESYIASHYTLPRASPALISAARRSLELDKEFKHKDPVIQQGVNEYADVMRQKLADIEADPNLVGRDNVLAAVRLVDPQIANNLNTYLNKDMPMPTRSAAKGLQLTYIGLGTKADPTSSPEGYQNRVAAEQSLIRGAARKEVISIGTAFKHLGQYEKVVAKWITLSPTEQEMIRQYGTSRWNDYLSRIPLINRLTVDKAGEEIASMLDNGQNIALNEVYKATTGGPGAERGREEARKLGAWRTMNNASLARGVNDLRDYLQSRLDIQEQNFKEAGGRGDFFKFFDKGGEARSDPKNLTENEKAGIPDLNYIPQLGGPPSLLPTVPESTSYPRPSSIAIEKLRKNPAMREDFDAHFGPGAADRVLK